MADSFTIGDVTIDDAACTFSCVDRGEQGGVFVVDFRRVARLLARLGEVKIVTREKAPELLDALREGHQQLGDTLAMLDYQFERARLRCKQERARVLLDVVPELLKGGPDTVAIRQAHVERAETVVQDEETVAALQAIRAFIRNKQDAVGRAFSAVKAVAMGERSFVGYGRSLGASTGNAPVGCGEAQ